MVWIRAVRPVLVGFLLVSGQVLQADESPAAVGRISYGDRILPGDAICSGVLVAPDLVLTAAHCVRAAADAPETIRFEADWSTGRPAASRRGAAVILVGGAPAPGLAGLLSDVALVILDTPFPPEEIPALALVAPSSAPLTLFGFDRALPDLPIRRDDCRSLPAPDGLLALDCGVVSGNSGAPLLERHGNGWRVVAVMVAAATGGPVRSWAVLPPPGLRLRIPAAIPSE